MRSQFPRVKLTKLEVAPLRAWPSWVSQVVGLNPLAAGGDQALALSSLPTGIMTVMSALSVAPSKACEYTKEGWEYLKERIK